MQEHCLSPRGRCVSYGTTNASLLRPPMPCLKEMLLFLCGPSPLRGGLRLMPCQLSAPPLLCCTVCPSVPLPAATNKAIISSVSLKLTGSQVRKREKQVPPIHPLECSCLLHQLPPALDACPGCPRQAWEEILGINTILRV